jgi:hypothetical protein
MPSASPFLRRRVDRLQTGSLGLHDQADAVRLALLEAAGAFRLGLGQGLDALPLDLDGNHDVGVLGRVLALGPLPVKGLR